MYKTIFSLPLPIEIQLIIFRFEHEMKYRKILYQLLSLKCNTCEYGVCGFNLNPINRLIDLNYLTFSVRPYCLNPLSRIMYRLTPGLNYSSLNYFS